MVTAVLHYKQAKFLNRGAAALAKAHLRRQVDRPGAAAQAHPGLQLRLQAADVLQRLLPDLQPDAREPGDDADRADHADRHRDLATATRREIDVLVLATGFNLWDTNFPAFEVIGRDGRNLGKSWREQGYHAFEGVTVPGFPNFISLNSPYSLLGAELLHDHRGADAAPRAALRRARPTRRRHLRGQRPRPTREFLDQMLERMDDTVFTQGSCATARSYYYTNEGDAVLLRPTSSRRPQGRRAASRSATTSSADPALSSGSSEIGTSRFRWYGASDLGLSGTRGDDGQPVSWSTKHQRQSSPGSAERITGWPVSSKCAAGVPLRRGVAAGDVAAVPGTSAGAPRWCPSRRQSPHSPGVSGSTGGRDSLQVLAVALEAERVRRPCTRSRSSSLYSSIDSSTSSIASTSSTTSWPPCPCRGSPAPGCARRRSSAAAGGCRSRWGSRPRWRRPAPRRRCRAVGPARAASR